MDIKNRGKRNAFPTMLKRLQEKTDQSTREVFFRNGCRKLTNRRGYCYYLKHNAKLTNQHGVMLFLETAH